MVKQNGLYNITVLKESFARDLAPDYILFYEEVAPNKETYSLLATSGGAVCTLGGVIFVVGLFRSRNARPRNRK
jgi:hypothetical protein